MKMSDEKIDISRALKTAITTGKMELGALCGKPFSVSALVIIDKGTSNILTL